MTILKRCTITVIILIAVAAIAALAVSNKVETTLFKETFTASNGRKYDLSIITKGLGYIKGKESVINTEHNCIKISDYTIPITRLTRNVGVIKLSLQQNKDGMLYFLDSSTDSEVWFNIRTAPAPDISLRKIEYGDKDVPKPEKPSSFMQFNGNENIYLEGGLFVKAGRISNLKSISHTVYAAKSPKRGVSIINGKDIFSIEIPIPAPATWHAVTSGAICGAPLVNWVAPHVGQKAIYLDSTQQYHLLRDGVYMDKPRLYEPYSIGRYNFIYKAVAGYPLKFSSEPGSGAYFRLLSASLLYSYTDAYNKAGYIPTQPRANWLYDKYGIDYNFYDTRFNFDTIDAFIYTSQINYDPSIRDTIKKALDYYINFAEKNHFDVNGISFVPDYGTASGKRSLAACSLNHYLTEATTLINGGILLNNHKYCAYGFKILNKIDKSQKLWIRQNKDLWYAVNQSGNPEKNDYVSVTYNDLIKVRRLLKDLELWEKYPGIAKIVESKEAWLKENGYSDLIS